MSFDHGDYSERHERMNTREKDGLTALISEITGTTNRFEFYHIEHFQLHNHTYDRYYKAQKLLIDFVSSGSCQYV